MKIQNTPNLQLNSQKQNNGSQIAFKSAAVVTQVFRFLETNAALGASAVDVTCMGIPRTAVDSTRGPDAGLETARREFSSTAVDAGIGAFGIGAAYVFSRGIKKDYGIQAHKMLISDDTFEILSNIYDSHKGSDNQLRNSLLENVKIVKGFNPDSKIHRTINDNGFVSVENEKAQEKIVDKLLEAIENKADNKKGKQALEEIKACSKAMFLDELGSERTIRIEKNGIKTTSSLDNYINDVINAHKAFESGEVKKILNGENIFKSKVFTRLINLNKKTAIGGLAIASGIACSLQPINMYLTKKKTGKSGFVGVEGREPDKSKGFKALKLGAAATFCYAVMRNIAKTPKDVLKAVQFKGIIPTIPQFKFVYGLTIVSRFMAARDKNELRESSIKDSLGFVNWLILGGFVSKLTAAGIEKLTGEKYIRYNKNENGHRWVDWLTESSIATREEVLHESLKKVGISTIKADGKAMTFMEKMNAAAKHAPEARTKIRYINMIQFAGYLWSGLALGFGIPKLNIAITKSIEAKRKAKEAIQSKNK